MKILFTLFVLLFSSSVVANNYYCNVTAHGFQGNEWRNYPDNVFLITYDNKNLLMPILIKLIHTIYHNNTFINL